MQSISLDIGGPANGGTCVGRHEGRAVFCRLSLPGETVGAELLEASEGSRFWRAEALDVEDHRNPGRVQPQCPFFVPNGCGGCSWLHASHQTQLDIKSQVLRDALERIGGVHSDAEVVSVGEPFCWRTKVVLHVDEQGRAGLRAFRSHDVVPVSDCLQADPQMDLPQVLRTPWPPGSTVTVSVSDAGRSIVVRDGGKRLVEGPKVHTQTVAGRLFRYAPDGFWQSHRQAAEVLSRRVVSLAAPQPGDHVVDLYAGVGLFGLTLLDACEGASVELVEGDKTAARMARRNAAEDTRVTVVPQDVRKWARTGVRSADIVVLDPPRAGAGRPVIECIAKAKPRTIIYVSCEPSTLARDLGYLREAGYVPDHIEGLDIFPGTASLESVVRLVPAAVREHDGRPGRGTHPAQ